jgi:HD-like signal output (HDOD) protein
MVKLPKKCLRINQLTVEIKRIEKLIKMSTALNANSPVMANAPFLNRKKRCETSTTIVSRSGINAGKSKNESSSSPFIK